MTTAATRHPHWNDIRARIEERFPAPEFITLQKWAIDAVSAHLMGDPMRTKRAMAMLGRVGAQDLIHICKKYDVTLSS